MKILGFILIYAGALMTFPALNATTCTQGDAGSLFGGVFSLLLYAAGFSILCIFKPTRFTFFVLVPAAIVAWLQASFAVRFASGYLLQGMSACEAMFGYEQSYDGNEVFYLVVWGAVNITFIFGLIFSLYRAGNGSQREA